MTDDRFGRDEGTAIDGTGCGRFLMPVHPTLFLSSDSGWEGRDVCASARGGFMFLRPELGLKCVLRSIVFISALCEESRGVFNSSILM